MSLKKIKPLTDARLDELVEGTPTSPGAKHFVGEMKIIDQLRALPFEDRLAHWNKISFFGPATY